MRLVGMSGRIRGAAALLFSTALVISGAVAVTVLSGAPANAAPKHEKAPSSGMSGKAFSSGMSVDRGPVHTTGVDFNAVRTALRNALEAARCDKPAVQSAISQTTQTAIARYGKDSAGAITSAIISDAEQDSRVGSQTGAECVTDQEIGAGLARAAAASSPDVAAVIAKMVANVGKPGEVIAFENTTAALGRTELASVAAKAPAPIPETPVVADEKTSADTETDYWLVHVAPGGSRFSPYTPPPYVPGGGGCLTPSCTML